MDKVQDTKKKQLKLIWVDKKLTEQRYLELKKHPFLLNKEFHYYDSHQKAFEEMKTNIDTNYIVISSGMRSIEFNMGSHRLPNVLGIVLTTGHVEETKEWSSKYIKMSIAPQKDGKDDYYRIIRQASRYIDMVGIEAGQKKFVMGLPEAIEFKIFKKLFDEKQEGDVNDIIKELKALLNEDGQKFIEEAFKTEKMNIVRGFSRCYSSSAVYTAVNTQCWTKQYQNLIKTVSIVLRDLVDSLELVYDDCEYLYRGIRNSYETLEKDYKKGSRGHWPPFSSTTLDFCTALTFSEEFKVVLRIKISTNLKKIHPCIKIWDFSQFPEEKEVLFFPFFAFIVTDVTVENGVTIIDIVQDEENSVLSVRQYDYTGLY